LLLFFKKEDLSSSMKIATWNVNGSRAREKNVLRWLERENPDFLLLQEIKCEAPAFPPSLAAAGWHAAISGQKGFNGVAILSRTPLTVSHTALPCLPQDDAQARYIEIDVFGLRIGNLYLPNGNSGGAAGYAYKLQWMNALYAHAGALLADDTPLVLAGDYNVCPEDIDYAQGTLTPDDALLRPPTRAAYWQLIWSGLTDAVRAIKPTGKIYTFWDYQAGAWQKDRGLRIDHALLSPTVAERLKAATPQRHERGEDTPSDHVPLVIELA
jgi:exodeoxyribonuclease-3